MKKKTNYAQGHFAEKLACLFLMMKGYRPIVLNKTFGKGTGAGEVDLIMAKNHTLVFVEVKKRKDLMTAAEAITYKNKTRIMKSSALFVAQNPQYRTYSIRYDAVLFYPHSLPKHIINAWQS